MGMRNEDLPEPALEPSVVMVAVAVVIVGMVAVVTGPVVVQLPVVLACLVRGGTAGRPLVPAHEALPSSRW